MHFRLAHYFVLLIVLWMQPTLASQYPDYRRKESGYPLYMTTQPSLASLSISSLPKLELNPTPDTLHQQYTGDISIHPPSAIPSFIQLQEENELYKHSVGNQLQLGTCASFAVVDALLHQHNTTLSPAYLNVNAKQQYAHDCSNDGLNIGLAMQCALDYGTVMDWVWPYKGYYAEVETENKKISNSPQSNWDVCVSSPYTPEQDKGLVKFGFQEIKSLFGGSIANQKAPLIRAAIIQHRAPVVISVPVSWNQEWLLGYATTGKIKTILQSPYNGWHAVSLCGFNETKQEFTFKNSWGTQWGDEGFGTMSYAFVNKLASEAWIGFGTSLKS